MTVHTTNSDTPADVETPEQTQEAAAPTSRPEGPEATGDAGRKAKGKGTSSKKPGGKKSGEKKQGKKSADSALNATLSNPQQPPGKADNTSRLRRFGRTLLRPRTLAPLLVILALLGGLGWGGAMLWDKSQTEDARASALDAGRRYATDLATYSYQNLDNNLAVVRAHSAGEFSGQYQQVASNLKDLIVKYQSNSSAKIVQAGLVSGNRDAAEVIVFLDQTVTNTNSPQPRVDRNRMQLTLLRQDSDWKLSNVQLM